MIWNLAFFFFLLNSANYSIRRFAEGGVAAKITRTGSQVRYLWQIGQVCGRKCQPFLLPLRLVFQTELSPRRNRPQTIVSKSSSNAQIKSKLYHPPSSPPGKARASWIVQTSDSLLKNNRRRCPVVFSKAFAYLRRAETVIQHGKLSTRYTVRLYAKLEINVH